MVESVLEPKNPMVRQLPHLLRPRREWPRNRRAAERGYHFPSSDSDRHVAFRARAA